MADTNGVDAITAFMNAPIPQMGAVNPAMSAEQKGAYQGQVNAADAFSAKNKEIQQAYDTAATDYADQQKIIAATQIQHDNAKQARDQYIADGTSAIIQQYVGDPLSQDSAVATLANKAQEMEIRAAGARQHAVDSAGDNSFFGSLFRNMRVAEAEQNATLLSDNADSIRKGINTALDEAAKQSQLFSATVPTITADMAMANAANVKAQGDALYDKAIQDKATTDSRFADQLFSAQFQKYGALIAKGNEQFNRESTAVSQSNQAKAFEFNALEGKARLQETMDARNAKIKAEAEAATMAAAAFTVNTGSYTSPEQAKVLLSRMTKDQQDNLLLQGKSIVNGKGQFGPTTGASILNYKTLNVNTKDGSIKNTAGLISSIIGNDPNARAAFQEGLKGGAFADKAEPAITSSVNTKLAGMLGNPSENEMLRVLTPAQLVAKAASDPRVKSMLATTDPVVQSAISTLGKQSGPVDDKLVLQTIMQNGKAAGYSINKATSAAADYFRKSVAVRNTAVHNFSYFGMDSDPEVAKNLNTYRVTQGRLMGSADWTNDTELLRYNINEARSRFAPGLGIYN